MISCLNNYENGLSKLVKEYERYAVYFSPTPETELAKFGSEWLGLDALSGKIATAPSHFVESPRRYGFHATLKAPMRLADGISFEDFCLGVERLASQLNSTELGILKADHIGDFLALKTDEKYHGAVSDIAWRCVRELDEFRASLSDEERNKRKNLTPAESENLEQWGYPYVHDSFRFHMTLTSSLLQDELAEAMKMLVPMVPNETTWLNSICIFGDPGSLKPFEFVERFDLRDGAVVE